MVEEQQDIAAKKKPLGDEFLEHLNGLKKNLKGVSKVNKLNVGKMCSCDRIIKMIVFQIDNENYLTVKDAVDYIGYHLDRGGFIVDDNLSEVVKQNLEHCKMIEIDSKFENDDVMVTKLDRLTKSLFENILKVSEKKIEPLDIISENINFYDDQLLFKKIVKENIDFKKKGKKTDNMFNEIEVSDDSLSTKNDLDIVEENIFLIENRNKDNNQKKKEMHGYQPFSTDWTNEMVDSIIGNMYNGKDIRKKNSFASPINYQVHPPQFEHEFLEMQNHMVKNDRTNSTRPFVCHFRGCNRAFKRFEHLKRHYRIHTGERPFKCKFPGCHKAFARSDNLNQHLRVHNGGTQVINHSNRNSRYLDEQN